MAAALVDKNDNFKRIHVYHVDDISAADKALLVPAVRKVAARAARDNAAHLPRFATVHARAIEANLEALVSDAETATLAMFARPFDDGWIALCEDRARREHEIGIDFRYRAALLTTILLHLSREIGRRWFWNGRKAAHLLGVAQRILQLDSSVAAAYHNAITREAELVDVQGRVRDLSAFQARVDEIRGTIGDVAAVMDNTSQSLNALSRSGAEVIDDAYRSADEVARNINQSASATEELSASIAEIGHQALQSSELAQRAVEETGRGNEAIGSLRLAAENIGSTVELISKIAAQTNLLALNATIEAARAGDAGRGFAVVASEVKALASQTAQATQRIGTLIQQVQVATRNSVESVALCGALISDIASITLAVSTSVREQSVATQEIARSGGEIMNHAARLAGALRTANSSMRETLETSESMARLSRDLLSRSRDLDAAAETIARAAARSASASPIALSR